MLARHIQRGNAIDVFALDPQDLAARRNNGSGRTQTEHRYRQARSRIDDVFAIVEDKKELLSSNGARDGLRGNLVAPQLQPEDARNRRRYERRIQLTHEIDPPAVALEVLDEFAGNLQ